MYSKVIYRIGDVMFDFANNTFLAGLNPASLSLVAVYQSLESVIGIYLVESLQTVSSGKKLLLLQISYVAQLA